MNAPCIRLQAATPSDLADWLDVLQQTRAAALARHGLTEGRWPPLPALHRPLPALSLPPPSARIPRRPASPLPAPACSGPSVLSCSSTPPHC